MTNISYKGYDNKVVTVPTSVNLANGALVTINSSNEAVQCTSGQEFIGVCVHKTGNIASVQLGGYVECKYTGAAPNRGYARLKASGASTVTAGGSEENTLNKYKVLKVDTAGSIVGFIL